MEVWKMDVGDRVGDRGLNYITFTRGQRLEVEGRPYVRTEYDLLVPWSDKWFTSKQAARDAAADKIEEYVGLLLSQANALRQELVDAAA
jgi:hypothetical protein